MQKQTSNDASPPRWRDISQVTGEYPFSRPTLYHWINCGLIESRVVPVTGKQGSGKRVINVTSLEALIRNSPTKSSMTIMRRKREAGRASAKAAKLARITKNGRRKR